MGSILFKEGDNDVAYLGSVPPSSFSVITGAFRMISRNTNHDRASLHNSERISAMVGIDTRQGYDMSNISIAN